MTSTFRLWRDWPLLFVALSALATLLLCVASICSLAGIDIGWLLPYFDYRSLPIFGPLLLGALVAASLVPFWRALVARQRQRWLAVAGWRALAGLVLLATLSSYANFFRTYRQEDSASTSHARYYLLSHENASEGREIITIYACDRSGTWCHQVYATSAETSVAICSGVNGGCFLKVEAERVLVYVGGDLVYTAGP